METGVKNRPHLVIKTEDTGVHVLPVSCIESIIEGGESAHSIDNWDSILRTILAEWLLGVEKKRKECACAGHK